MNKPTSRYPWALALSPNNWLPALACGLGWLLVRVLPHRGLLALGAWVGSVFRRLSAQRRLVASTNLLACFPEQSDIDRAEMERRVFEAAGKGAAESALAFWGRDRQLDGLADIQGRRFLQQGLSGGKGVLVLMAHYTPVELACRLVNRELDRPVRMLARRHNHELLETLFERGRSRHSGQTLEKKDLIGLRRALRDNQAVFYAPDQNFTYQSVFAPFFSIPAATVTATADIVARSGAALVPLWCRRQEDGRYRLRFEAPWTDYPADDPVADATRVNAWIEAHVREAPEQYLWIHRRFKSRPDGEPPFYPERARRPKDRDDQ